MSLNTKAYRPSQIVPTLADQGVYLASEATIYCVLREADEQHARGRVKAPRRVVNPKGYKGAPKQTWSWDSA